MNAERELVLVVDDDEQARKLVDRILAPHGFTCCDVASVLGAREMLRSIAFPLVLCDVRMPGGSGLDLLEWVREVSLDAAIVMVSAEDDPEVASIAIDRGVYGYLVKPYTANELLITVANALHRRRLEIETGAYRQRLEADVAERTAELRDAVEEIDRSRAEIIRRLSRAVEARDRGTGEHIERIGELSAQLAYRLGLPVERVGLIRLAAPMHDVGKIAIADDILRKPGALTAGERVAMQEHAQLGHDILSGSGMELLELAATIALTHHERWDGTGYPRGLAGEKIPLEGRIVAVGDVYDALSSDRAYRAALPHDEVVRLVEAGSGTQFDPAIIDLFVQLHGSSSLPGKVPIRL